MRVFRQVPQTFELCYTNQVIIKLPQLFVFLSEKPVIKIKSPQPSSVIEGSTLNLDCVATGFPRPRVTWVRIRDGQVLQNRTNDEATSLGRNFTKCDEGEYRCKLLILNLRNFAKFCVAVSFTLVDLKFLVQQSVSLTLWPLRPTLAMVNNSYE